MSKSVLIGTPYGRRREQTPVYERPLNRAERLEAGKRIAGRVIPRQRIGSELGSHALGDYVATSIPPVVAEVEETLTDEPDPSIPGPDETPASQEPTAPEDTL